MKRIGYSLLIVLTCFATAALAQNGQNQEVRKQIEAAHVAAITKQLELTPEEAQRFWPIYNNYQSELEAIARDRRQAKLQNGTASDANELDFDSRVLDLRKRYQQEFRKALPEKRAMKVFRADREFREQLIRQLKNRRRQPS